VNNFTIHKALLLSLLVFLSFVSYGMEVNNFQNNDSILIQKTKHIIEYCNASDSLELLKLLRIEKINNEVADNSVFLDLVFSFNLLGKKNKILSDTFFEKPTEYCYKLFGKYFVLVVGKDTQVFEFNNEGYLIGFYVCVMPSKEKEHK